MRRFTFLLVGAVLAGFMLAGSQAKAAPLALSDGNSTATIDWESQDGMESWTIDGTEHLFQQWFWYRVGDVGPESSINTLPNTNASTGSIDGEPGDELASLKFENAGFSIEISYTLHGGTAGSGTADIAESISIKNKSLTTSLPFHFFQYSDFDLGNTNGDDEVYFPDGHSVVQKGDGYVLSETVITPPATHHEGKNYADTLNSLNDLLPTTLDDTPAIGGGSVLGDVTWAFQWDTTIGPGGTFIISKDKQVVVPEPGSLFLLGSGLLGLARMARKKARKS
jgi:hypothetical protein